MKMQEYDLTRRLMQFLCRRQLRHSVLTRAAEDAWRRNMDMH